jgi:hypothetical protein
MLTANASKVRVMGVMIQGPLDWATRVFEAGCSTLSVEKNNQNDDDDELSGTRTGAYHCPVRADEVFAETPLVKAWWCTLAPVRPLCQGAPLAQNLA